MAKPAPVPPNNADRLATAGVVGVHSFAGFIIFALGDE